MYGSYGARYEDHIVQSMVQHDAGKSDADTRVKTNMKIISGTEIGKLELFSALREGRIDATWLFLPWEGAEYKMSEGAEQKRMNVFQPATYGVPYGHSPLIARNAAASRSGQLDERALRALCEATSKRYEYAVAHPEEAARISGEREGCRDWD